MQLARFYPPTIQVINKIKVQIILAHFGSNKTGYFELNRFSGPKKDKTLFGFHQVLQENLVILIKSDAKNELF